MFLNDPFATAELGLLPTCQPSSIWKCVMPRCAALRTSARQNRSFTFVSWLRSPHVFIITISSRPGSSFRKFFW